MVKLTEGEQEFLHLMNAIFSIDRKAGDSRAKRLKSYAKNNFCAQADRDSAY